MTPSNVIVLTMTEPLEREIYGDVSPYDFEHGSKELLNAWLKANNCHFYARPKEDFFVWDACKEAEAKGLSKVIVEDLS